MPLRPPPSHRERVDELLGDQIKGVGALGRSARRDLVKRVEAGERVRRKADIEIEDIAAEVLFPLGTAARERPVRIQDPYARFWLLSQQEPECFHQVAFATLGLAGHIDRGVEGVSGDSCGVGRAEEVGKGFVAAADMREVARQIGIAPLQRSPVIDEVLAGGSAVFEVLEVVLIGVEAAG